MELHIPTTRTSSSNGGGGGGGGSCSLRGSNGTDKRHSFTENNFGTSLGTHIQEFSIQFVIALTFLGVKRGKVTNCGSHVFEQGTPPIGTGNLLLAVSSTVEFLSSKAYNFDDPDKPPRIGRWGTA
ncbi:hypothetical protein M0804_009326 [Polistes exclamans]|nr:hypothetical protein M0804_009326 [Polistes exclamans]